MTQINLTTYINAPLQKCFDMSRDVKVHELSTAKTNERAIAGRTSGLFEVNDTVTWEATHFGIRQKLTVKITKMNAPHSFEDMMLKGAFKKMVHAHSFVYENSVTKMSDVFEYEVPFGLLGWAFNKLILKAYMTKLLKIRNQVIKNVAENTLK